ncbi:hypothetical protein MtrunA17_Chr8g0360901 [Medicago truncatula]|uniref:Uncharacterized protein n=1 Tax=Medicago truncatula TaxID=3880 RepID=A0A396GIJ8_MEDTR|nr:hypothetical protein MtrunA17_Chr8g0360891 [Medicago truncatula]RHN40970.1 hypothetical protein MtrunA17_Chr8g0360901 [Medicago truncatula]
MVRFTNLIRSTKNLKYFDKTLDKREYRQLEAYTHIYTQCSAC